MENYVSCYLQVGVCKRMQKEVESYEKEVITNEARGLLCEYHWLSALMVFHVA